MMTAFLRQHAIMCRCPLARHHAPSVRYGYRNLAMRPLMAQPARLAGTMTVDEFLVAKLPEGKSELVHGEVRMTPPPGGPHAVVSSNVILMLMRYLEHHP